LPIPTIIPRVPFHNVDIYIPYARRLSAQLLKDIPVTINFVLMNYFYNHYCAVLVWKDVDAKERDK
jgi:hypothetical protein